MSTIKPQNIIIPDKKELYKCYMPFIQEGAIFIPFNNEVGPAQIELNQTIFLVLTLPENRNKFAIHGTVVWINRNGTYKGYGVSFGETASVKALRHQIEIMVGDLMLKKEPTYTI